MLDKNQQSFIDYQKVISQNPLFQDRDARRHLDFFSEQFLRPTNGDDNLYKISSAYFNHCIESSPEKIYGILYPSVDFKYYDLNVALLPEAVDKYLALDMVVKYELNISGKEGNFTPMCMGDIRTFNCE